MLHKEQEIKKVLLEGFCDTSKIGYAACIYLCAKYTDESRSVKMIAAKTRVAPLKHSWTWLFRSTDSQQIDEIS